VDLHKAGRAQIALLGSKGANLGELSRIEGIRVPRGFCVTTTGFERLIAEVSPVRDRLERLRTDDLATATAIAAEIRRFIVSADIPDDVAAAITDAVTAHGGETPFAVRSSATAEDLLAASSAGQQDSYLNIVGAESVLQHVRRCWASLFTERAVIYRRGKGVDDGTVRMAVVVQEMVAARAAGVLFTAEPVTSNRRVVSVEATAGLGAALVAGLVNPDVYTVRDNEIIGTRTAREQPVLTDALILELAHLGRRIESYFGSPQDIEWSLADDGFQFVQSRPITALFPVPAANDEGNHVYVSVGHQQMMTDAIKPLGISMWQLTAARPMFEAGARLFVDITHELRSPAGRAAILRLATSDALTGDALQTIIDREFVPPLRDEEPQTVPPAATPLVPMDDPAIVTELIQRNEVSIARLKRDIQSKSGLELFDFILRDLQELKRLLFGRQSMQAIRTAMDASSWLNDRLKTWLGETNAADTLTQSAPNNVTSEMGLALLDLADAIRPHREVVAYLQHADENFLDRLPQVSGGDEAREAIERYLDLYGMRCAGEIDITRPRWRERPSPLVPLILDHIRNFEPGERIRRFERGRQKALEKEHQMLARLRALPGGEEKAEETKRMIDRVRTFAGYREFPKYVIVSRYLVYKQALLKEAEHLVRSQVFAEQEDIFYLAFDELRDVTRSCHVDEGLISRRKDAFQSYQALTPPRVLTSDGEVITGTYRRDDVPAGALAGLPVSSGTVEGRAAVVLDMAQANLEAGAILVTTYTDPGWTPLFVGIAGLVTEVGGLMTHGAVIAREYGLPAVVGVEHATQLIRDGQRIRVNGTQGCVEILSAV
jgi:pyruvate,water dikinase